jgi:hypothetical protein
MLHAIIEKMRKISIAAIMLIAFTAVAEEPKLRLDHLWIVVSPGAPERAALAKAGFRIAPELNKHEGQGTAAITVEFDDGFFELMWVEPTVPIAPGAERGVEKFRQRAAWRTSGRSPFGINLSRTKEGVDPVYPFPTWSLSMPWMEPGTSIVMLTPRDDIVSPSVSVHPHASVQKGSKHPNGVKRITSLKIVAPRGYTPAPSVLYARDIGVIELGTGDAWLAEVTFDKGAKKKTRDLRPELPLLIHY